MPFEGEIETQIDEETGDSLGADPASFDGSEVDGESQVQEPTVDHSAELRAEIETLKAKLSDSERMFREAFPVIQQQRLKEQEAASRPPIEYHQIQNADQLKQYLDWQNDQNRRELVAQFQQTATQSQSEAVVRAALSRESVGPGWSYDDVHSKYVAPLVRQDPKLADFFYSQQDPAMNMYMVGLFHSLLDHFKGDTVKMVKTVVGAVTNPAKISKDVVRRIDEAAKRGATKVLNGSNQGQAAPGKTNNYFDLPDKEFKRLLAANG